MMSLGPDTILQRAAGLALHLDSANDVRIVIDGRVVPCGSQGLRVLDAFAWPTPVRVASERLQAQSAEHWIHVISTITHLHEAGVLRDASHDRPGSSRVSGGFAAPAVHVLMLNDRIRTSAFLAAIREVVRPGDVVVDIGTGTGVLAIGAARAGAARVYAIESTAIADVAEDVFATSGVGDRITLVRGWSSEVVLPERADVLISETIGNDPMNERLLEIARDARRRLLKPGARYIPGHVAVFGLPVTIPGDRLSRRVATPDVLERWRSWYDVDFTALARAAGRSGHHSFEMRPSEAREWPVLSAPVLLAESDVASVETSVVPLRTLEARATTAGTLNGLLVYFEARLGSTVLSTHPALAGADNSWASPVWYLAESRRVEPGETFRLQYRFGRPSDLSEVTLLPDDRTT